METSFGNWIRRRRKALDMTQEELGKRVGCSTSAIFKIESDERRPSRQLAELLANCLEIPDEQRVLFLKIARQEKAADNLDTIALPGGPTPAPALSVGSRHQSSLPVFPTPLVGRAFEIGIVTNQLRDPACRLLTLTGPGGVGKTRLAAEVAGKLESAFPDGVFFLPMTPVNLPESIIPAIANGVGITFSGPADPMIQVINVLRDKKMLLVIDNMEHLTAGSTILGEILQQTSHIQMLLTSREALHLQWEWIFDVQGLPVPETGSANALESNSAAILFLQRTRQTAQNDTLSTDEANALVKICKLVDGLPLAIELAASWVRIMSFQEIAQELERSTDLLETTMRDIPARHRSIKAVFDQSWELLKEEERTVIMRLSVFSGGFTRKAADAVAGASLPLLSSLVSKSLLRYSKKADRYDFHELVRQYFTARLNENEKEKTEAMAKHSSYFSDWLASRETAVKSSEQIQASSQIRAETGNWLSAWNWAVQNRRLDLLRKMTPCLYWYYEVHGYYTEALSAYHDAVSHLREDIERGRLGTAAERSIYAYLVDQYGWFHFRTGNIEQAVQLFQESLELARESTDDVALYHLHINWGYLALLNGDIEKAKEMTLKSLEYARRIQSLWYIAIPENILGIVEYQQGNQKEAYQQLARSLNTWRTVGDPRGLIFCMLYLSSAALTLGNTATAKKTLLESNTIAEEKMDHWAQAFGLDLLGKVAMVEGEHEKARDLFQQSLAKSDEIGDKWAGTQARIHLGEALIALGRDEEARQLFQQAYRNAKQAKWTPTILEALVALLSVDQEILPETRLAIMLSILSHPAASPTLVQQAERLRERFSQALTAQQIEEAHSVANGAGVDWWEQPASLFSRTLSI